MLALRHEAKSGALNDTLVPFGRRSVLRIGLISALLAGCGAAMGPPLPTNIRGPNANTRCPAGTVLAGSAPPKGQIVYCVKNGSSAQDRRARIGPVVSWACGRCKDGEALHGHYILGERDGLWTLVAKDGRKIEASDWHHGNRYGRRLGFHPDGSPHFLKTYGKDGKKLGPAWSRRANGTPEFEGGWEANYRHGLWKTYNKKGKLRDEGKYRLGAKTGMWKELDDNGDLIRHVWYERDEIVREGRFVDGKMRISSLNKLGERTGTWSEKGGKRHGVVVNYFPGTSLVSRTTNYVMGVARGPVTLHRPNGTKMAGGDVIDGKRQCGWRFFDRAGKDVSRAPALAATLQASAATAGVKLASTPCEWTLEDMVALRNAGDAAATVAAVRWLVENEVEKSYGTALVREPASDNVRLQVTAALVKAAAEHTAKERYVHAALLHVAALVEANRALGGSLLSVGPTMTPSGASVPPAALPKPEIAAKFKAAAQAQLPAISFLLNNREQGPQDVRKAGRITLGRIGLDKMTLLAFRKKLR